ncbi:MAG: hypothetical protein WA728_34315, partial [Xanthobacteraceae bacterium]
WDSAKALGLERSLQPGSEDLAHFQRALPALTCPSPAKHLALQLMPDAARERVAKPPAGTAPAP